MFALAEWLIYFPITQLKDNEKTALSNNIFKVFLLVSIRQEFVFINRQFLVVSLRSEQNQILFYS